MDYVLVAGVTCMTGIALGTMLPQTALIAVSVVAALIVAFLFRFYRTKHKTDAQLFQIFFSVSLFMAWCISLKII